jgi:hypothetical protein
VAGCYRIGEPLLEDGCDLENESGEVGYAYVEGVVAVAVEVVERRVGESFIEWVAQPERESQGVGALLSGLHQRV